MKKLFHGTTVENLRRIREIGFGCPCDGQIWTVSDRDTTYFYHDEEDIHEAMRRAIENGQIACAIQDSKYDAVGLICLTVLDSDMELFEEDYSCDYMDDIAVNIDNDVLNNLIDGGHIEIEFIETPAYSSSLRPFYLTALYTGIYLNKSKLSDEFLEIVEVAASDGHCNIAEYISEQAYNAAADLC